MMVVGSIDDSEDAKKIKVETSVRCHKFDPFGGGPNGKKSQYVAS